MTTLFVIWVRRALWTVEALRQQRSLEQARGAERVPLGILTDRCLSLSRVSFSRGVIQSVQNAGSKPGPLIHCHTAEGHTKAVLSVAATEDLLFTSSKGRSRLRCRLPESASSSSTHTDR